MDKKRALDLVLAVPALVIATPIVLFAAAAIAMTDRHNPFFTQTRFGLNRRPFTIYKLRTMRGTDATTAPTAAAQRQRITRLGHFLRRSGIDELPQVWNVLKGDMAVVGPRPLPFHIDVTEHYATKPGITGICQIHNVGYSSGLQRVQELESCYLEQYKRQGLSADLGIVFETAALIITGRKAGGTPHRPDYTDSPASTSCNRPSR